MAQTATMTMAANPVVAMPYEPEDLLTRDRATEALAEAGYPVSKATLATMAVRGGGPPFVKFGFRVLYEYGPLIGWAKGKTSAPRRSTSEPLVFNAA